MAAKVEESSCYRHPMADGCWDRLIDELTARLLSLDWRYVKHLVDAIEEKIKWLDPIMTKYCLLTCQECEDCCCQAREIYFNRTDMLYLAVLNSEIPPGQTRTKHSLPCRYLTPDGCILPRSVRPYVCVWFICEAQIGIFQEEPAVFQRCFLKNVGELREHRLTLESLYERGIAPAPIDKKLPAESKLGRKDSAG